MLPPEYLRVLLADARALGVSFEDAWPPAVRRAAAISDDPAGWVPVLAETRDAWRRAYASDPATLAEQALGAVGDGRRPSRELDARRCEQCDRWIPTDRDVRARFCSERCKRRFNYERERSRARRTESVFGGVTVAALDRRSAA